MATSASASVSWPVGYKHELYLAHGPNVDKMNDVGTCAGRDATRVSISHASAVTDTRTQMHVPRSAARLPCRSQWRWCPWLSRSRRTCAMQVRINLSIEPSLAHFIFSSWFAAAEPWLISRRRCRNRARMANRKIKSGTRP